MTDEGPDHANGLAAIAARHGVGLDAVRHLVGALERGEGRMAQFDHPDLGGMGQWSAGGMVMVGRMFDDSLRARVSALCAELAAALPPLDRGGARAGQWWPEGLGRPSSTGAQDGMRYAYFPETRRLAIESGGGVALYDTGAHRISGVSQANGRLAFDGPGGPVLLDALTRLDGARATPGGPPAGAGPERREAGPAAASAGAQATSGSSGGDILALIERLADLHARGVLTEREFADKKAELLSRL